MICGKVSMFPRRPSLLVQQGSSDLRGGPRKRVALFLSESELELSLRFHQTVNSELRSEKYR